MMRFIYSVCIILTANFHWSLGASSAETTSPPSSHFWKCKYVRRTEKCDGTYVQFYLKTRYGSQEVEVTDDTNNITSSLFDHIRPNIIVIHGYNADMNLDALVNVSKEYLKLGDYNVWAVNYPTLVENPCYPFAVYNVAYVGRCVSLLISAIREIAPNPHIHIVGFSLGAHVAGRAGYEMKDEQIDRITGLDPALPLFVDTRPGGRLSKSDAKFVDVIHTNMFIEGHYGELGHVDFYVNGGSIQPGCSGSLAERTGCYHQRSVEYFAESINTKNGFWGVKCSGLVRIMMDYCSNQPPYVVMGDSASRTARGQFYVKTKTSTPFAGGIPVPSDELKRRRMKTLLMNSNTTLVTGKVEKVEATTLVTGKVEKVEATTLVTGKVEKVEATTLVTGKGEKVETTTLAPTVDTV